LNKQFSILKILLVVLTVCLAISLFFNGYLYYKLTRPSEHHSSKFFSFVFGPTQQNITKGNLYLNLTFDVVEGNLTVKAEVNADEYNSDAFLALQFDSDNNGTIDIPYLPEYDYYDYDFEEDDLQFLLRVNNHTRPSHYLYWGWLPNGTIYFSRVLPSMFRWNPPSMFHICTYNGSAYIFRFTFPIEPTTMELFDTTGKFGIQGKLVRILYGIEPPSNSEVPEKGMTVYVPPFNFME